MIGGDAAFGDDIDFRDGLTALGLRYCVGWREATTVWEAGRGRCRPSRAPVAGASLRGCGARSNTNSCRSKDWL